MLSSPQQQYSQTQTQTRRHVSLPQPTTYRENTLSSSPRSIKSHDTALRSKSRLSHLHASSVADTQDGSRQLSRATSRHPLQAEIKRLTAACEEHERKIRVTKATIEHRLFTEWPQMITRLSEIDDKADQMTTQIHAALNSTIPTHQARLDSLVQARRYDAQQVKDRTTPWVNFFARQQGREREKAKLLDGEDGARGRILRVDGVLGEGDGLSRIERWAEEVEMYFTTEIMRLRTQLNSMSWRRRLLFNVIALVMGIFTILFLIGAASIYLGERRPSS